MVQRAGGTSARLSRVGEVSRWDVGELIPRNYSAITAQLAANELINGVAPHAERRLRGCVVSGVHSGVGAHKWSCCCLAVIVLK